MSEEFSFDVRQASEGPVVVLRGELDVYDAGKLRDCLDPLVTEGGSSVVVDMSGVSFLDSTGLGVFVAVVKKARALGGDVVFRRPSEPVMAVLRITGLTHVFTLEQ